MQDIKIELIKIEFECDAAVNTENEKIKKLLRKTKHKKLNGSMIPNKGVG